jgi:hypothetical protein
MPLSQNRKEPIVGFDYFQSDRPPDDGVPCQLLATAHRLHHTFDAEIL